MSGPNGHDILREGESQVKVEDAGGFRWRYEWRAEGVGFAAWRIIARQTDGLKLAIAEAARANGLGKLIEW